MGWGASVGIIELHLLTPPEPMDPFMRNILFLRKPQDDNDGKFWQESLLGVIPELLGRASRSHSDPGVSTIWWAPDQV